jgi:peptidyl-prolyl cis-trans isomerase SurA
MLPPKSSYKTILFLAIIFQSLALAAPVFGSIVDRVVARVNNEIITLSAVKSKVALLLSRIDRSDSNTIKQTEKQLMQQSLDSIIDQKLQTQEGKKIGLIVNEETIDNAIADIYKNNNITADQFKLLLEKEGNDFTSYKKIIHDQILSSKAVKMQLHGAPLSSNRDAFKYYKANKKKYWVPGKVVVSQIMFIKENDSLQSDIKLKRIKAQEVLGLLRSGNDFSDLAKKYSEDVTGPLGGRVGVIERGTTLPKFEEIAFNLKLNEVSGVFQTENGIHIIRCDDIISGYYKSFKDVKPEIKRLLDLKKKDENYIAWMKGLRESAFIEVKLFENSKIRQNIRKTNTKTVDMVTSKRVSKKISSQKYNNLSIESQFRHLKKLRDNEKISNKKYLEKKKELLRKF